jgi:acyl-CoA 6-desaturase (Delta-6 desaturase)
MHNKHHATPQKINHDLDLDTLPLVAFFTTAIESLKRQRPWSPSWIRYQAYTFLPITAGFVPMFFWNFFLHPRKVIRDKDVFEALFMVGCHVFRPLSISYFSGYSFQLSYLIHLASMWVSYVYLFGHFSLSHTFTPVVVSHSFPIQVHQTSANHT